VSDEGNLLPCPFCGGEAQVHVYEYTCAEHNYGDAWVACKIECAAGQLFAAPAQAIAAWNRRVPAHREGGGA